MANVTTVSDISNEFTAICTGYLKEVEEATFETMKTVGKEGKKKVSQKSPRRFGKYAKGWKVSSKSNASGMSVTIHNKVYRLTHLLENGHALPQGGRAKAYPHIKPTEDWVEHELERRLERILSDIE